MKTITLKCEVCEKKFEKLQGEYNRRIRLGKNKFYCSVSCSGNRIKNKEHIVSVQIGYPVWELNNPKVHDEYSGFRPILKKIKHGKKRKPCNVTLQDLKEQWDAQKGLCFFTGLELELKLYNKDGGVGSHSPYQASLDRIDNSKPYEPGNIRFICLIANYARNNFSDEELINFCQKVVDFKKN
jgi:hypothetical protein